MCRPSKLGIVMSMIEIRKLTKKYGGKTALDGLSFSVEPGTVAGFLGPNGAGKSTTMRIVLGLARADHGEALVAGQRYVDMKHPLRRVGALLDAGAVHPGMNALNHLRALAYSNRISSARVIELIEEVGLSAVARKRIGGFSLGMRQRLGIAAALLGDPEIVMFDEPINGLDPDGVRWFRQLVRRLASDGRTVLVSSHLMTEMELTADRLIIIGRGRLIADTSVSELAQRFEQGTSVHSPMQSALVAVLQENGAQVGLDSGGLLVSGMEASRIADLAAAHAIPLHQVTPKAARLEDAYMSLTADSAQYHSAGKDD